MNANSDLTNFVLLIIVGIFLTFSITFSTGCTTVGYNINECRKACGRGQMLVYDETEQRCQCKNVTK